MDLYRSEECFEIAAMTLLGLAEGWGCGRGVGLHKQRVAAMAEAGWQHDQGLWLQWLVYAKLVQDLCGEVAMEIDCGIAL
ncbi:hypothetical protein BHE74_00006600 [Ensete ventricosum]|nr:hypothetical protein BHE74_00006600 [Ensete ventricosum]